MEYQRSGSSSCTQGSLMRQAPPETDSGDTSENNERRRRTWWPSTSRHSRQHFAKPWMYIPMGGNFRRRVAPTTSTSSASRRQVQPKQNEQQVTYDHDLAQKIDDKIIDLFTDVLEIYWKKYAKDQLHPREFLNCRLICKAWKDGVDKIIFDHVNLFDFTESFTIYIQNEPPNILEDQVNEIIEMYAPAHSRLFPVKTLHIIEMNQVMPVDAIKSSRASVHKLLLQIGESFRRLIHWTDIRRHYMSLSEWYATFLKRIRLMPNLEKIEIEFSLVVDAGMEDSFTLKELEHTVATNPFPKLESLKILKANLPAVVLRSILISNDNIKDLQVSLSCSFDYLRFPTLKSFTTTVSTQHWNNLITLNSMNAPLLKIMHIKTDSSPDDSQLECIFKVVNNFWQSLTCLKLEVLEYSAQFATFPFAMSNLCNLTLNLAGTLQANSFWNEDRLVTFVSPLKSLQSLVVENFNIDDHAGGWLELLIQERTKVGIRKLIECKLIVKLWEVLPHLKNVEVKLRSEIDNRSLVLHKYQFIRKQVASSN